jgi:hypothetical protein
LTFVFAIPKFCAWTGIAMAAMANAARVAVSLNLMAHSLGSEALKVLPGLVAFSACAAFRESSADLPLIISDCCSISSA